MAMRLHVALVCALCLLAFTPIARAGDDLDLSAGDFKISVGADDDHEGSSEQDKEPGELVIKLPPEPKAARAYVPIHATIEDQNGDPVPGGQLTAVAVQQPIVVAPVIGAQGAPYGACTDNCDAEMAPPPVQIAGPTVASQILNKEIFEDESYIPVPETQVEAKPAMVSVPMHLRDGGGAANDQTVAPDGGPTKRGLNVQDPESTPPYLNSGGDPTNRGGCPGPACHSTVDEEAHQAREEKYKRLLSMDKKKRKKMSEETKKQHEDELDELKKQVDKDRETLAKEKEKARASRQDEEDRKEEQFQEERSKWKKKERAEEETQKDEERKRAELKLKLMKAKVKAQQVDDASDDIEDITAEIAALKKKLKAKQAGTRA